MIAGRSGMGIAKHRAASRRKKGVVSGRAKYAVFKYAQTASNGLTFRRTTAWFPSVIKLFKAMAAGCVQ